MCTSTVYIYCSENCRQNSWNLGHRWDCFGSRRGFVNHRQKLCLSLLFNATRDGFLTDVDDKSVYGSRNNNYPFVNKLVTNRDKIEEKTLNVYIKCAVWLVLYLKNFTDYFDWLYMRSIRPEGSKEELLKLVGGQLVKYLQQLVCNTVHILNINYVWDSVEIAFRNQTVSGIGIYVSSALLNHSCIPNSIDSFFGTKRVIRAITDIKNGTEITINYLPVQFGDPDERAEKRELIQTTYMFKCSCQLCIDPKYEGMIFGTCYMCPRCSGRALISNNILGQCNECNFVFNALEYTIIDQRIQHLFKLYNLLGEYNKLDMIYKLMKKIYHKYCPIILVYYTYYMKYFYNKGEIKKCVDKTNLYIELSKNVFGDTSANNALYNVTCALVLAKYSKTLRNQKSKYYNKYLNETKGMIQKCIDIMEYTMSTYDIKKFIAYITKYLNSDEDDITFTP